MDFQTFKEQQIWQMLSKNYVFANFFFCFFCCILFHLAVWAVGQLGSLVVGHLALEVNVVPQLDVVRRQASPVLDLGNRGV